MLHDYSVRKGARKSQIFLVLGDVGQFGFMPNCGIMPVCIRRVGAAVGFQVIDSYFSCWNSFIMQNEPVVVSFQSDSSRFMN